MPVKLYPSLVRQQIPMIGKERVLKWQETINRPLQKLLHAYFETKRLKDPFYEASQEGALIRLTKLNLS